MSFLCLFSSTLGRRKQQVKPEVSHLWKIASCWKSMLGSKPRSSAFHGTQPGNGRRRPIVQETSQDWAQSLRYDPVHR